VPQEDEEVDTRGVFEEEGEESSSSESEAVLLSLA
jgi:hypothetical protein